MTESIFLCQKRFFRREKFFLEKIGKSLADKNKLLTFEVSYENLKNQVLSK